MIVGASFFGLGIDLKQATFGYEEWAVGTLTLSGWDVGLLLATVVVSTAWVAGFRPSIRASIGFLIVALVAHLGASLTLSWVGLDAWATVVGRIFAIVVAAALCFTRFGRTAAARLRKHTRGLLKMPPAE